ncbi:hypothetical protein EVAR_64414_1 [Eumeta japonica]|uniref:Uncharacterized protein n=1 Tax=Eumeta variegata TaxID=151549 RepID=A0A4C1ZTK5_EUMVA|nr:hypothetical protein EVAR_64414_1 [Eumeta japonica]
MSKPLEKQEEFWAVVRDILLKFDKSERIILLLKCRSEKVVNEKKKAWLDLFSEKANHRVQRKDILKDQRKDAESTDTVADDNVTATEYMIDDGNESEITMNEIMKALKRMKVGKAAGYDELLSEMLRGGGDIVASVLYQLFNKY